LIEIHSLKDKLNILSQNSIFQKIVISVIILSAFAIGLKSHNVDPLIINSLEYLDYFVTIFFVIEISIRMLSYDKVKDFFKDGWNVFDFIIVSGSLIPFEDNEAVVIGRLLRIFRILRLVSYIPELKRLTETLLISIPKMGYVCLMMFIIFYIYAAFGNIFFASINPDLWGNISSSLLTLFRIATFEDWTDVMYETQKIYFLSWVYYISFIFFGSFIFLNMMVGIIIDSFSETSQDHDQAELTGKTIDTIHNEVNLLHEKVDFLLENLKKKN